VSVVAGKSSDKVVAPMIYSGTADSSLFENWFENQFCPEISGNICVMDNASIHRKKQLFEIAEKFNVILIFQPPYSPDLNKIEKYWAWLKKKLKTVLRDFVNLRDALSHCFQLK
jgi:transposase